MFELFSGSALTSFFQVVAIDLVMAGDNAIVIGLAASGLSSDHRYKAILLGILGATLLRIFFAATTTQLLQIIGLLLAGGILLLWVCWKMWRELHVSKHEDAAPVADGHMTTGAIVARDPPKKTLRQATWQIIAADVSMSLDNVLAVAGAARDHPAVLVFGLALSVALMAIAASAMARILERHRWLAYLGLLIVLYVALEMIYRGAVEVWPVVNGA